MVCIKINYKTTVRTMVFFQGNMNINGIDIPESN